MHGPIDLFATPRVSCEGGFAAFDRRRAAEAITYDASDSPWMQSRLRGLARSYEWLLAQEREESSARCAAGVGMLVPLGARRRPRPLVRTGLVPAVLPAAFGLAWCRVGLATRSARR